MKPVGGAPENKLIRECRIPRSGLEPLVLRIETGRSVVIVGANGSGKTRLGVFLEGDLPTEKVHRLSAQKSLAMTDSINLISLERASNTLRYGYPEGGGGQKFPHRWAGRAATYPVSDFDPLQQSLFAQHNDVASRHLREHKEHPETQPPTTKLEELKQIWDELLSHRILEYSSADIKVRPSAQSQLYRGSEMSDGERAIFYFLGQCLMAPVDSVLIIDEPEGHIHKAIVGQLWDAIENARPDCGFIYITHDLDFATTRSGAAKFFVRSYDADKPSWDIDEVPDQSGLPERVLTELLGSRKPILFVEGERNGLDMAIYRHHYKDSLSFRLVDVKPSCTR